MKEKAVSLTEQIASRIERGKNLTVVAAIDESKFADQVYDSVKNSFDSPDNKVVFIYVSQPLDPLYSSYVAEVTEARNKQHVVEAWVKKMQLSGFKARVEGHVLVGDPKLQLCQLCDELKPDKLIMGSHGKGFLRRALLGSVSTYCTQHCNCEVTVVKPTKEASAQPGAAQPGAAQPGAPTKEISVPAQEVEAERAA